MRIIFFAGDVTLLIGDKLYAIAISALWGKDDTNI